MNKQYVQKREGKRIRNRFKNNVEISTCICIQLLMFHDITWMNERSNQKENLPMISPGRAIARASSIEAW